MDIPMLDDFFIRAMIVGIAVALVAGPFGCIIVWRRLAYFGDTLAHSGLLGVALAFVFQINITLAVLLVCLIISASLLLIQRQKSVASDAILGMLSHTALALGLVVLALLTWVRVDLMGLLFGDILAVSKTDIVIVCGGGALLLLALAAMWRPLFASIVNEELAKAEGVNVQILNLVFVMLMAVVIAIAMKLVGVLLITALLIIPASAARSWSQTPEMMAVFAALIGAVSVVAGLNASLIWDTPSGPSVVIAAFALFVLSSVSAGLYARYANSGD